MHKFFLFELGSSLRSSVLYWNNARKRTKKFWSKTIGFEPSHSFLFRCLNLYLYPRSYSEGYLRTVSVNKLIRLANPKRKKFHFTGFPPKNQILNPRNILTKFKKLRKKLTEKFYFRQLLLNLSPRGFFYSNLVAHYA